MQYDGSILDWNDDKGFGFISSPSFESKVFFHIKSVKQRNRRPSVGDSVVFQTLKDTQGRNNAVVVSLLNSTSDNTVATPRSSAKVRPANAKAASRRPSYINRSRATGKSSKAKRGGSPLGWLLFICYWVVLSAVAMMNPTLFLPLVYLAAISVVTYLVYALDKRAARNNQYRVSESHLHFLSLIGGWSGALVARYRLRHKSIKTEFRIVFWITVIMNSALTVAAIKSGVAEQFINSVLPPLR
ncbi:MAG: cold shock and DUF1294 domain-containing protein [Pseudomonadales bacterium]|jgi:uncharacterized membrane protein YsdA (DUF1294 family)/cold shock CspA family protein